MKYIVGSVLLIGISHAYIYSIILPVSFDSSMQTKKYRWIVDRDTTEKEVGFSGTYMLDFFRSLYEKQNFITVKPKQTEPIPHIIHQIWIGDSVPVEFSAFQQSWQTMHPTWQYRLWTQYDIPNLPLVNRILIEQAQNPAEKSDLLRYEILNLYGGVYVDMDFECLQPLDVLNDKYDFYIGIQPLDCGLVQLGSGLIGAIPGHPIIKKCIDSLELSYAKSQANTGITVKSGPVFLTKIFIQYADCPNLRNVALPAHYFYPLTCRQPSCDPKFWLSQGSFGIHHWAKSWNKPEYRRPQFRAIKSWGTLY
ncbi:MAG TPA: glycosyltransferase [Candidatus Babeliales bacterium]|jgi:mannosyltransferase OCH1-like enzyme|nr:glycosyltransferase [Candidatus Babeliales bacterium]